MRGTDTQQKKRGSTAHWRLTEDANVKNVARKVSQSIADMNKGILEAEDLYQEGLILVAATPHLAARAIEGEFGLLYTRLRTELMQKFVEKMDRSGELQARKYKNVTFDDADNETKAYVLFDAGSGDYTDEAIKLLLPAVWDETYAYGLPRQDDAPEEGMPKSASNKARGNSHWAFIGDIKTGWEKTPLSIDERRALILTYGLGWTQKDSAINQGVVKSVINDRIQSGIKKITARLNGASIEEEK